jgi:GNAT superfamily N-acetyltransferase
MADELVIRTATLEDMPILIDWAAKEGWKPGIYDAELNFLADPTGYSVAALQGEVVGCVGHLRYGNVFGYICFFIVKPEHRGKGFGRRLFERALVATAACPVVMLDGVPAQWDYYTKRGFLRAYNLSRFKCNGLGFDAPPPEESIVPLADVPFDVVCAYDQRHFLASRPEFLRAWISQPESLALGVLRGGRLCAMGVRRRLPDGFKVAPLFADTPADAAALLRRLRTVPPTAHVYIDAPEASPEAMALVAGMEREFTAGRMFRGPPLPLPAGLYAVTSFEVG